MYVVLVYDISKNNNGQKRWSHVFKICKKYLSHIQNSVFEGEITKVQLTKLQQELIPSVNKGIHGRKRIHFSLCRVAFIPRTSSTRQSSALQRLKWISFRLFDPVHRYLSDFQGGRLRRTGRTPIEDNVENHSNIMEQGVYPLVH